MTLDGFSISQRQRVVEEAIARPQPPQWRRTHQVSCEGIFRYRLDGNAVAGPDVMHQKVTVGMDDLVAQGSRHGECPGVDHSPWRRCDDGGGVTSGTPDLSEQPFPAGHAVCDTSAAGCVGRPA